jgi:hypothetical protein
MDVELFEERGVRLAYNQFEHPEYEQLYEPFLPYMAVIDALFNCGPRAVDLLRGAGQNGSER